MNAIVYKLKENPKMKYEGWEAYCARLCEKTDWLVDANLSGADMIRANMSGAISLNHNIG